MPRRLRGSVSRWLEDSTETGRVRSWVSEHTIVLGGLQVQANEVGQQEVVLGEVPGTITHNHGVRVIGCGARSGHVVQRRHDGGSPTAFAVLRAIRFDVCLLSSLVDVKDVGTLDMFGYVRAG